MTFHFGQILAERGELQVIDCQGCGYAHLERMPSEAELADFYREEFWQTEKAGALERIEAQADWLAAIYGDWLGIAGRQAVGNVLLDVGCGYGHFLKAARSDWRCYGIEANREAHGYATNHGSKVFLGNWQNFDPPGMPRHYDCISALWVLEHLNQPDQFLLWARRRLYDNGLLILAVPQEWTIAQSEANRWVEKKAWWLDKTHINYFDRASLYGLLGRCGFRVVDALASHDIERFITTGYANYVDHPELGQRVHKEIEAHELAQGAEARVAEYRQRARRNEGRDLIVFAVRE